jgi:hypothetical protein
MPQPPTRRFTGGCHCGAVTLTLAWKQDGDPPLRRCTCAFCVKQGAVYIGHEDAALTIDHGGTLAPYRFGTGTATFHRCARCGTFLLATCTLDGRLHAVLNARTLDGLAIPAVVEPRDYEGETTSARLDRRRQTWIPDVAFVPPLG